MEKEYSPKKVSLLNTEELEFSHLFFHVKGKKISIHVVSLLVWPMLAIRHAETFAGQ